MRFCSLLLIITTSFCGISFNLLAQQVCNHKIYFENDGLLSSHITDLTQAPDGTIWVSTILGISQYDGSSWTNFPNNEYDLPKGIRTKIKSTSNGTVWVAGFKDGEIIIRYWQNEQWNVLPSQERIPHSYDYDLFSFDVRKTDTSFKLVINCNNVFEYREDLKKWELIVDHRKYKNLITYKVKYDLEGTLFLGTTDGLKVYKNNALVEIPFSSEFNQKTSIYAIGVSNIQNKKYVVGTGWIGEVKNGAVIKKADYASSYVSNPYNYSNIDFNLNDELIFNGFSPLFFLKNNSPVRINFNHELTKGLRNTSILSDRENNLWIGTTRGLIKLNAQHFKNYNKLSGFLEDEVSALFELKNSKEIIVGSNKSFAIFSKDTILNQSINASPLRGVTRILRITQGSDGKIYFAGNSKGLGIWDKKRPVKWYESPNNRVNVIGGVFEYNTKIYAISARIIYQFDNRGNFSEVVRVSENIRKIHVLSNGEVLALATHIYEFKENKLIKKFELSEPYRGSLYGVCEWNDKLLVATRHGLQEAKGDSISPITINNQPIEHPVYALLVDSRNNLWVGTAKGIFQFVGDKVNHYKPSNGLIGNEINRNALIEDSEGKIWIGTEKGVSVFDYRDNHEDLPKPILKLKSIKTDKGTNVCCQNEITLNAEENDLAFSFAGVSFRDEEAINYRYRLNGFSDQWHYVPSNEHPTVRYTSLQHGSFQFELQARNGNEEWTDSIFSNKINIKQAFSESLVFYAILILCAIGIGVIVQTIVVQKNIQKALKKKVEEKVMRIKSSEAELKAKNNELLELNKELDTFVYSASHDLKSPLNSLKGLIGVIGIANSEEEREVFLKMMEVSVQRLRDFIDDLEALARNRRTQVKPMKVDFELLMRTSLENVLYSDDAKHVDINFNIENEASFISDRNRIGVIINNLLSNGIRYKKEYIDDAFVRVNIAVSEEKATISVEDNGIGIPKENIDKIFNMFEKGGSKKSGSSGLGLYIVKETVEKLQGSIRVESKQDEGSTFIVELPSLS